MAIWEVQEKDAMQKTIQGEWRKIKCTKGSQKVLIWIQLQGAQKCSLIWKLSPPFEEKEEQEMERHFCHYF